MVSLSQANALPAEKIAGLFCGDVGEVLYLSRNFRSTYGMNLWFNRVFRELLPENTPDQSRFESIPLPEEAPEFDGCFGGIYGENWEIKPID